MGQSKIAVIPALGSGIHICHQGPKWKLDEIIENSSVAINVAIAMQKGILFSQLVF